MNTFDFTILRFLTGFANLSPTFDTVVQALLNLELLKGGVVMALFWWAWFQDGRDQDRRREVLVAALIGAAVSLFLASALAMLLPFRLRPVLAFPSEGVKPDPSWTQWSAFPSDHATLFFALAFGLYRAVPALSWIAFAHAALIVCFPRIYIGLHYPTDILAGAVLGMGCVYIATRVEIRRYLADWPLRWMKDHPGSFYAGLFVATYAIATLFHDFRLIGLALLKVVRG